MIEMIKDIVFYKHLRRFLGISEIIFFLVFLGHLVLLLKDIDVVVAGTTIPSITSIMGVVLYLLMFIMAGYYRRAFLKDKKSSSEEKYTQTEE